MKKILVLAIVLLSLTACEDGVLFTLRGKTYIHWDDENRASTLNFSTNKKGVKNNWTNYNEGKLCPENMGAYTDFEYVLEYPKLKIIYNDSIEYNYIFAGEDLFQGNDEYNTDKYMRID
jgi:hypothetical protein